MRWRTHFNTKGKPKEILEPVMEQITQPKSSSQLEEDQIIEYCGEMDMIMDERYLAYIDLEWIERAYKK